MKKINHWCIICGKGYHACDTCLQETSFAPWRTLTDSIEHFKVYMVLKSFNNKEIDAKEAKEKLDALNIIGWESFNDSAKNVIKVILSENKKIIQKVPKKTPSTKIAKKTNESSKSMTDEKEEC